MIVLDEVIYCEVITNKGGNTRILLSSLIGWEFFCFIEGGIVMIQLNQIKKTFKGKEEIHAVDGVDLTINKGEIFGIIGYSGAGKSTILRVMNQLEKQDSGKVFVDELEISSLKESELRKQRQKIGMIFQHFNLLWSRTVEGNIEFPLEIAGLRKEDRVAKVKKLIEMVGLQGKEKSYPSELSGGQKQRVGIARALANSPKYLLCDEATSALDPETTDSILNLLATINKNLGITIVMITHQMEVVQKICHKVAVMSEGKVVEIGLVKDLFSRPKHGVTKRFVQTLMGDDVETLQESLKIFYPNGKLLRLVFSSELSGKTILSSALRKLDIDVNVVSANITHTQEGATGVMYIHLEKDEIGKELILELENKGVKVEGW